MSPLSAVILWDGEQRRVLRLNQGYRKIRLTRAKGQGNRQTYSRLAISLAPDQYKVTRLADFQELASNKTTWNVIIKAQTSELPRRTRVAR